MFRVAMLAFCWSMVGPILVNSTKAECTHEDNNLMGWLQSCSWARLYHLPSGRYVQCFQLCWVASVLISFAASLWRITQQDKHCVTFQKENKSARHSCGMSVTASTLLLFDFTNTVATFITGNSCSSCLSFKRNHSGLY